MNKGKDEDVLSIFFALQENLSTILYRFRHLLGNAPCLRIVPPKLPPTVFNRQVYLVANKNASANRIAEAFYI